jgi:hypothetical protein
MATWGNTQCSYLLLTIASSYSNVVRASCCGSLIQLVLLLYYCLCRYAYHRNMFPKVTTDDIDNFKTTYQVLELVHLQYRTVMIYFATRNSQKRSHHDPGAVSDSVCAYRESMMH